MSSCQNRAYLEVDINALQADIDSITENIKELTQLRLAKYLPFTV